MEGHIEQLLLSKFLIIDFVGCRFKFLKRFREQRKVLIVRCVWNTRIELAVSLRNGAHLGCHLASTHTPGSLIHGLFPQLISAVLLFSAEGPR